MDPTGCHCRQSSLGPHSFLGVQQSCMPTSSVIKMQDPQRLGGSWEKAASNGSQSLPAVGTPGRGSSWPIPPTQCHGHTGGNRADSPDLGVTTEMQAHFLPPHLGKQTAKIKQEQDPACFLSSCKLPEINSRPTYKCTGADCLKYTIKKHSTAPP